MSRITMNNLIRQWNGRVIRQREDGYLSATDMCQAVDKLWGNWYRLDSTKEYLKALQSRRYSDLNNGKLIDVVQGGIPDEQGTWVYRKVALRLAQWLSAEFAVQVDEWTDELLIEGRVELVKQQPTIAPEVEAAREINEIYTRLADHNPRIAQLLVDSRMNRFMGQAALPGTAEVWKGAVEIAEDLGFKTNHKNRGILGRHVKERVGHLGKTEKRLCNGTNQPIMLYPDTDEVKNAVKTFFVTPIGSKQG